MAALSLQQRQEQASADREAFHRPSADPGRAIPKPILTVYAYTLEAAHQIAAAKIAGETIVLPVKGAR